jgi:hypothetical protein
MEQRARERGPAEPRIAPALVAIGIGAAVVTAFSPQLADLLVPFAPAEMSSDLAAASRVALIACFIAVGLAVRLLAGVPDAWYAMFAGAFAGGVIWAATMLVAGPPRGPVDLLTLPMGGVAGAWAVGIFGSVGFGLGTLIARLFGRQ